MSPRFDTQLLCNALNVREWRGASEIVAEGVSTDTRKIERGALFFALKGPNFDAHDYLDVALEKGAGGVVVQSCEHLDELAKRFPHAAFICVADTQRALGDLAAAWRKRQNPKVLVVTGSNGKTTTKELLAAMLATRWPVLKTEGNLNNLIGLPLTMLGLEEEPVAVLEAGMNALGEIDRLAEIAAPDIGLITNVFPAHLELLGSIENVQRAKGELFNRLGANGHAIVNLDNPYTRALGEVCRARTVSFSLSDPAADVFAEGFSASNDGFDVSVRCFGERIDLALPLPGRHNVANLLAAVCAASVAGLPASAMPDGVKTARVPGRRLKIRTDLPGLLLIDDCYNANPSSMSAALSLLMERAKAGRAVAILGDMLELGETSPAFHEALGREAAESGVALLLAFGNQAEHVVRGAREAGLDSGLATDDIDELAAWIKSEIHNGDTLLVKGSRGMKLERAVAIIERLAKGE